MRVQIYYSQLLHQIKWSKGKVSAVLYIPIYADAQRLSYWNNGQWKVYTG